MRRRDATAITDGTAQDGRLSPALGDHFFHVDERDWQDLVARSAEFAKSVRYYNLRNRPDGSWSDAFANDEAVVMADMLTTDSSRMEAEFLPLLSDPPAAAAYLTRFSRRIDRWYQRLSRMEDDSADYVGRRIRAVVEQKLAVAIQQAAAYLPAAGQARQPAGADAGMLTAFDPMWGFEQKRLEPAARGEAIQTVLRSSFYALVSTMSYLKPIAADRLQHSLKSGNHDPGLALYLAFAHLLGKTQQKINQFTARHRDFYYNDVLRMTAKDPVPDSTFLVLQLDTARSSLLVPAGTAFDAGKAGGKVPLVYQSEDDLLVTDALVRSLLTLHSPRDPLISPEQELGYVDGLRTADILSQAAADSTAGTLSWPLFGAEKPGTTMSRGMDASVGFALASSALQLKEGDRRIRVTISYRIPVAEGDASAPNFADQFRRLVLGYSRATKQAKDGLTQQAADLGYAGKYLIGEGQDPKYIFKSVVGNCFQVDVTASTGWYAIKSYGASVPPRPSGSAADRFQLTFDIALGADAPSLAAYNPALHGPGMDTRFPVLRFRLNPQSTVYGYSLFRNLGVEEIAVESTVSGATRIVAWNQFGQVDPSKPFQPFGPQPTTNSYLVLGNYDCARMNLTELNVAIEWGDLPYAPEGLGSYYKDYGKGFENDAFVARLSVLRDGRWRPSAEDSEIRTRLFDGDNWQSVASTRVLNMEGMRWFKRIDPALPEEQFRYDQKARGGFFRIELAAPEAAFGHRDYPSLLTAILTENARASRLKRGARPLPPPPYTPVVNRMSLSYTASSTIGVGSSHDTGPFAEKFLLIHPFGVEAVTTSRAWLLLPEIDFDGNLYIGFSATHPVGELALLFHLREDSVSTLATARQPVNWSYLASNKWHTLDTSRVLSDTTDGFLSSGIVTLDLPVGIDRNNTVMPPDLYWLRVSAGGNFASFCSLYAVSAQALTVRRKLAAAADSVLPEPLPVGSIKGPVNSIPGLRSVSQPLASSGGQELETEIQKRTRTAERLRHKGRAVTPWDYERLVLDAFPDVFKVKCFPAMSSAGGLHPRPGSMLIVVVPRQSEQGSISVFDPKLDVIKLKRIRDYLSRRCSPQAVLEIRNPAYERILIRCKVRLKPEAMRERGVWLGRLNQTLIEYISPWSKIGPTPRFGWSFQNDQVEAYIRGLPYVDFVTQFSMLHLTQDEQGLYRLNDTARQGRHEVGDAPGDTNQTTGSQKISPRYPWSIAIPNAFNIVEAIEDGDETEIPPVVTGIGKLVIGNTFLVIRRQDGQT